MGDIDRVLVLGQKVVGAVERNEALGVFRRLEDAGRIVDSDDRIAGRVEHEQRLSQPADVTFELPGFDVFQELLLDAKGSAHQQDLGFAAGFDLGAGVRHVMGDVGGFRRRPDGDDGLGLGHARGRGEHRLAAETVTDQKLRRGVAGAQEIRGRDQIVDV
ncbi:MAG: hypothetical protein QGG17_01130, partial [Rhodospirillales bacterium]|nr:hypothetical protein [Rhodospirillales bacterium]